MTDNMTEKPLNYERLLRQAGLWSLAIAVFLLIDYLSSVLLPFFVAWLFAYLLYPMVSFADRRLHTPRALSILLTLIVVIAVITGVIYLIIPFPTISIRQQTSTPFQMLCHDGLMRIIMTSRNSSRARTLPTDSKR